MRTTKQKTLLVFVMAAVMCLAMSIGVFAGPSTVAQTAGREGSVTVSWMPVTIPGASKTYYGVQLAADQAFTNIIEDTYTTTTEYYISSLTAGTTYYARIGVGTASNNCKTDWSTPVECVTAPAQPTGIAFVDADDQHAYIAWNPSPGATGYQVEYQGVPLQVAEPKIALPHAIDVSDSIKVQAYRVNNSLNKGVPSYETYFSGFSALTMKVPTKEFAVSYLWPTTKKIEVAARYSGDGYEIELSPAKGKGGKKVTSFAGQCYRGADGIPKPRTATTTTGLAANTMYKFRIRPYVVLSSGAKKYANWSDYRYAMTSTAKIGRTYGGIKLVIPKLKGTNKVAIKISTSKDGKYKNCATISGLSRSKTYIIRKIGKKSLSRRTDYHVKVFYYAGKKASTESDIVGYSSVYYY